MFSPVAIQVHVDSTISQQLGEKSYSKPWQSSKMIMLCLIQCTLMRGKHGNPRPVLLWTEQTARIGVGCWNVLLSKEN